VRLDAIVSPARPNKTNPFHLSDAGCYENEPDPSSCSKLTSNGK
jgi:hypothetical protein